MTGMTGVPGTTPRDPAEKVVDRETLIERWGRPRAGRLVFTNGCFDLLHHGHARYLHEARGLGDVLVVGVNSDRSVRRLKGPGRPVVPERERILLLASMEAVDMVTLFDEATPLELVSRLLPDILAKGGDYQPDEVVGAREVRAAGGEVRCLPLARGASTTGLIERIRTGRM